MGVGAIRTHASRSPRFGSRDARGVVFPMSPNASVSSPPILTRRTVEILKARLEPDQAGRLSRLVDDLLADTFGWFLRGEGGDLESDFHLAVGRYQIPRLRVLGFLVQAVGGERIEELLRSVSSFSLEILSENRWKLDQQDHAALRRAFRRYEELIAELAGLIASPPSVGRQPFNLLLRSTRMDFCLSASVAYLEGDIEGEIDDERLSFLCQLASEATEDVLSALRSIRLASDPQQLARWRDERLARLAGAWGDEPGMEEELRRIYDTRLDLHRRD